MNFLFIDFCFYFVCQGVSPSAFFFPFIIISMMANNTMGIQEIKPFGIGPRRLEFVGALVMQITRGKEHAALVLP